MNFADRLLAAIERCGNPCLVGLDPHLGLLPDEFAEVRDGAVSRSLRAERLGDFLVEVIHIVGDRVPAVKPQAAFFEVLGADGQLAWERVVVAARDAGLLVVGDVKRGDVPGTAAAYATAYLGTDEPHACDAITVNPLLGGDSVEPFLDTCAATGRGLYVLVRTSNPGSEEFQRHGQPELSDRLAAAVVGWGRSRPALVGERGVSSIGAVVGATHRDELARFRRELPHTPLLLPGYGAQGATASDVAPALAPEDDGTPSGVLVNASRSVVFPWTRPQHRDKPWRTAVGDALGEMIHDLAAASRAVT